MRWKLLLLSSLTAAFLGALIMIAASSLIPLAGESRAVLNGFILLIVALFPAAMVYRRTAKRRKTQALLTVVFTVILAVTMLFAILELSARIFKLIA